MDLIFSRRDAQNLSDKAPETPSWTLWLLASIPFTVRDCAIFIIIGSSTSRNRGAWFRDKLDSEPAGVFSFFCEASVRIVLENFLSFGGDEKGIIFDTGEWPTPPLSAFPNCGFIPTPFEHSRIHVVLLIPGSCESIRRLCDTSGAVLFPASDEWFWPRLESAVEL